jgi:hypothetical protein
MLPSGEPVVSKLQGEGEPRAVPGAHPGEVPAAEDKQVIADLHEPPPDLPKGETKVFSSSFPQLRPAIPCTCIRSSGRQRWLVPAGGGSSTAYNRCRPARHQPPERRLCQHHGRQHCWQRHRPWPSPAGRQQDWHWRQSVGLGFTSNRPLAAVRPHMLIRSNLCDG